MSRVTGPAMTAVLVLLCASCEQNAESVPGSAALTDSCNFPHRSEVKVGSAAELASALGRATPGELIRLTAAVYEGNFQTGVSGTSTDPIVLCGPEQAVLDGGSTASGYVLHLSGANYWVLSGFTVKSGKKGIVLDHAGNNLLTGLTIRDIGEEALRLRAFSSDNALSFSSIRETGRLNPGYGEAVYIGTTAGQWAAITGSSDTPDQSDRNRVLNNTFGPNVTAEHVDVKEGTTGGEIRGNTFDGRGISGANYADSWIDLKGNGYRVADNTGADAPADGFQLHVKEIGWGNHNTFSNNLATVNGAGYGFNIDLNSTGNVVACDNVVRQAASGFANLACASATRGLPGGDGVPPESDQSPPDDNGLDGNAPPGANFDLSKWYLTLPSGQTVQPGELSAGYVLSDVFYTDPGSGGMVFRCPNLAGTTANSSYSRTELREMRSGGGSARDDANNWRAAEGGVLRASLRVDRVSTTGDDGKVGRVIIGQIHGADSEPVRLYFHKRPDEARGRIYAGHDTADNHGSFSRDIVGNGDGGGIALGELFHYEVRLVDTRLTVTIRRDSAPLAAYETGIDPAYRGENLYFKAGAYNQNNTGERGDYVQATFLALEQSHPG